jgi:hypothetical protein
MVDRGIAAVGTSWFFVFRSIAHGDNYTIFIL